MSRYVDVDKAIENIDNIISKDHIYIDEDTGETLIKVDSVFEVLENTPTADVEEVRHGKWERCGRLEGKTVLKCSVCGQGITSMFAPEYHFCPNCGAKMDGGNDERRRETEKEARSNV